MFGRCVDMLHDAKYGNASSGFSMLNRCPKTVVVATVAPVLDFRVKEAIAKKDKQSEELVKQRDAAVRRADYAEQLLIEQGKKLLGKN